MRCSGCRVVAGQTAERSTLSTLPVGLIDKNWNWPFRACQQMNSKSHKHDCWEEIPRKPCADNCFDSPKEFLKKRNRLLSDVGSWVKGGFSKWKKKRIQHLKQAWRKCKRKQLAIQVQKQRTGGNGVLKEQRMREFNTKGKLVVLTHSTDSSVVTDGAHGVYKRKELENFFSDWLISLRM